MQGSSPRLPRPHPMVRPWTFAYTVLLLTIAFLAWNLFAHPRVPVATPRPVAPPGLLRPAELSTIELFEQATVLQNLLVGRHAHMRKNPFSNFLFWPGVRKRELAHRETVEDIIDLLEIAQYRDERIADLPYGARKNVEMARALRH